MTRNRLRYQDNLLCLANKRLSPSLNVIATTNLAHYWPPSSPSPATMKFYHNTLSNQLSHPPQTSNSWAHNKRNREPKQEEEEDSTNNQTISNVLFNSEFKSINHHQMQSRFFCHVSKESLPKELGKSLPKVLSCMQCKLHGGGYCRNTCKVKNVFTHMSSCFSLLFFAGAWM